jgi:hypothetical protein
MSDDEQTTMVERYMVATTTSNLKVVERTTLSATDILAAAGMAGRKHGLATQLWMLNHSPTPALIKRVKPKLMARLDDYMQYKKLKGRVSRITEQVMVWHIDNVCPECDGQMRERIGGTPHLSDTPCPACNGSGHRELHTENDQAALWLADEIKALSSSAETAIRRRIK